MRVDGEARLAPARRFEGREPRQQIDGEALRVADRVLHRGLEPFTEVQDDVGRGDRLGLVGSKLQVVRLDPGSREVRDVHQIASDTLGGFVHRIERRDDGERPRRSFV